MNMGVNEKDATAIVKVRGLGLAAFNPNKKRFENAILRHGNHELKMQISGPNGYQFDLKIPKVDGVEISITTIGKPETEHYDRYVREPFVRLAGSANDLNDYRWIFNFGSEFNGQKLVKNDVARPQDKPPVTKLFIENGLFYAMMPEPDQWTLQPFFFKVNTETAERIPFGFLSESIGVRMKAKGILICISIDGQIEEKLELDHVDDAPYRIAIENVDSSDTASPNEIDVLYQFLSHPQGKVYGFEGWVPFVSADGSASDTSGKNYCHVGESDGDGIDDFLP